MKIHLIYHGNCIDGYVSRWVWEQYCDEQFKDVQLNCIAAQSDSFDVSMLGDINPDDQAIIVDLPIYPEQLVDLAERVTSVMYVDHHATSVSLYGPDVQLQDNLSKVSFIINTRYCGALLSYQLLHPTGNIPRLLLLVDDYDRWVKQYPETDALNAYLWLLINQPTSMLTPLMNDEYLDSVVKFATVIAAGRKEDARNIVNKSRIEDIEINRIRGKAIYSPTNQNDIAEALYNKYPGFVVVYYRCKNGHYKCSFRRHADCDVNILEMAEQFGGGGHDSAAGCHIYDAVWEQLLRY